MLPAQKNKFLASILAGSLSLSMVSALPIMAHETTDAASGIFADGAMGQVELPLVHLTPSEGSAENINSGIYYLDTGTSVNAGALTVDEDSLVYFYVPSDATLDIQKLSIAGASATIVLLGGGDVNVTENNTDAAVVLYEDFDPASEDNPYAGVFDNASALTAADVPYSKIMIDGAEAGTYDVLGGNTTFTMPDTGAEKYTLNAEPKTLPAAFDAMPTAIPAENMAGSTIDAAGYYGPIEFTAVMPEKAEAVSYVVTFNYNDDGATADQAVNTNEDGTVTLPADPTREGYVFEGWFTEAEGGTEITAADTYDADKTVYAHWQKDVQTYTVNFDANGGAETIPAATTNEEGKITLPADPTREGYTFEGWFTAADGGEKVTADTVFTADATVYAHWQEDAKTYTITFDMNDGTGGTAAVTTDAEGKAAFPTDTTREGFTFKGWFTAAEGGTEVAADTKFDKDTTLYAHWEEKAPTAYTITFDVNGGEGSNSTADTNEEGKVTLPADPIRKDYTFKGWFTAKEGGEQVTADTVFDKAATVYARWEAAPVTYTITFDVNGGEGSNSTAETGTDGKVVMPADPTRKGYTFEGWFTAKEGGTKVTGDTVFKEASTVYAHWREDKKVQEYTITFDANGGSASYKSDKTTDQMLAGLPSAERAGYVFGGWFTAKEGGTQITTKTVFKANQTVYAHWVKESEKAVEFTITFDANGGQVNPTSAQTTNKILAALPKATRQGYTLKGWFTAKEGGKKVTAGAKFDKNTTLYAQWAKADEGIYTITFDANDGSGKVVSSKTTAGKLSGMPSPKRPGYQFDGWFTAKEGGDKVDVNTAFKANTTLYAHWTQLKDPNSVNSAAEGTNIWIWVGVGIAALAVIGGLVFYFMQDNKKNKKF